MRVNNPVFNRSLKPFALILRNYSAEEEVSGIGSESILRVNSGGCCVV